MMILLIQEQRENDSPETDWEMSGSEVSTTHWHRCRHHHPHHVCFHHPHHHPVHHCHCLHHRHQLLYSFMVLNQRKNRQYRIALKEVAEFV